MEYLPAVTVFKPAGLPKAALEEVVLTVEELEAVRLKDLEKLEQEECAARMRVSRPTFQRILGTARGKIADALINGKGLRIEGGNYHLARIRMRAGSSAGPVFPILISPFRAEMPRQNWSVPIANTRAPAGWQAKPVPAVVPGAAMAGEVPDEKNRPLPLDKDGFFLRARLIPFCREYRSLFYSTKAL